MKLTHYIYILGAAAVINFTACQSDDALTPHYTVGEAVNAITLCAGISDGGSGVQTRAGSEGHHSAPGHKTLSANTKLRLRVDGTWLGKTGVTFVHGSISDNFVTQTTTATVGDAITISPESSATHNKVTFTSAEQLYWDDYGSADPANMSPIDGNGRDKGLTIYGVAVDGVTNAPEISFWTAQTWTVGESSTGVIDQTGGWAAKDLLTSNNIQVADDSKSYATDGTYKFQDYINDLKNNSKTSSNLLEFTHAMSKITVVLTAGEGFDGYATDPSTAKFTGAPTVTLKDFKYKGNVSVIYKTSSPDTDVADVKMHLANGGANNHTATFDALVFPGNVFDDSKEILTLTADGNTFKVTAAKLNTAIKAAIDDASISYPATGTDTSLKQGWNYKIKITVNKTKIQVEATILDWDEVIAETAYPIISVTESYGIELGDGTGKEPAFEKDFDFFVSENIDSEYAWQAYIAHGKDGDNHTYTMHDQLYWPNHQIHYFFRGVWPRVGTGTGEVPAANVKSATSNASTIDVQNVEYNQGNYPSDLMIGYPRVAADKTCPHGNKVEEKGICATEGSVIMNFRYAMSQVKVILVTTTTGDKVNIDNKTKIEIVNGYSGGSIKLENGNAVGSTKATYEMHQNSLTSETTTEPAKATFHDAILPQNLTLDSKDLLFRVTIDNGDGTTDVYECAIKDINVPVGTTTKISAWESGTSYTYTLTIKKTAITAVATITPWTEVKAEENVWF